MPLLEGDEKLLVMPPLEGDEEEVKEKRKIKILTPNKKLTRLLVLKLEIIHTN